MNISEGELALLAQKQFEKTFPEVTFDEDIQPFRGDNASELRDAKCSWTTVVSDLTSSWQIGSGLAGCLDEGYYDGSIGGAAYRHSIGYSLGLFDGVLSLVKLLFDAHNPFSEENKHNLFHLGYWLDLIDNVTTKGVYQGLKAKLYDDFTYWKQYWIDVKDNIVKILNLLKNPDEIFKMFKDIYNKASNLVGDLLNVSGKPAKAGYTLGKLVFEVLLAYFTGGSKLLANLSKNLVKQFLVEWRSVKSVSQLSTKISEYVGKAWNDPKTEAARLDCLHGNCFIGTTPVHLYQQIMPIRDIPIHSNINAILQARRLQVFTPPTLNTQN